MKQLRDRLAPLLFELRGNPRLQGGIGVVAALAVLWLWLMIGDWREHSLRELARVNEEIERMQTISSEAIWMERAAQAAELKAVLDAEITPVRSPGLAQAAVQTWLTRVFENLNIRPQLNMEAPLVLERPAGVIRVAANLSGSANPQQVTELLRRIEGERQLMVVPLLQIRSESNETFQMTVHFYFRLAAEAPP